ncbi:MAG: GNAT family N-acetyltransferase [Candidatus Binatia bacterium]
MGDEVEIERARLKDAKDIGPLFAAYLKFYNRAADFKDIDLFLRARIENDESVIYVARIAGKPVGFAQLYPSFASLALANCWILYDLFVHAEVRGRGIGLKLLEKAKSLAEETSACEIFLQTAKDNLRAQSLYEKAGYVRDEDFYCYSLYLKK